MENEFTEEEVIEEKSDKEEPIKSGNIKTLFFSESFYCKQLGRSYKKGYYTAETEDEYGAIEPFGDVIEKDKKKMEVR